MYLLTYLIVFCPCSYSFIRIFILILNLLTNLLISSFIYLFTYVLIYLSIVFLKWIITFISYRNVLIYASLYHIREV